MEPIELLLPLSVICPLVCGAMLLMGGRSVSGSFRTISWIGFGAPFFASLILLVKFPESGSPDGFVFTSVFDTGLSALGIYLSFGLNGISMPLFLLAGIVGLAAGLYAIQSDAENKPIYLGLLLLMQAGLMGVFSTRDVFFLYFFHELALIPTFIMIGIWGGYERGRIAMELTVYLTVGAMLSLAGLIGIYVSSGADTFDIVSLRDAVVSSGMQEHLFGLLLFGLGILVSLFPFHSWAPAGYAAAPSSTAMLHAGVLKKFGLYTLIQVALPVLTTGASKWVDLLGILAIGNILIIGMITMAQRDLKTMLGYSSVMHMGYCFLGIASISVLGIGGSVILMFGHGLTVALLFLLATSIHHRTKTFDMREMGGLATSAPVLAGFFAAASLANLGLPGFASFWGEFTVFFALWQHDPLLMGLAAVGIVISAIYGLRAVARIFFGQPSEILIANTGGQPIEDLRFSEKLPAVILLTGLVVVGIYPALISDPINGALMALESIR